ncbi:DNA-binding protein [Sinorhizobium fredii USDA 205]|uniref:FkbM family methyltransferase n=2 Tax=Rhizobium fredii TaxID=380 RepID=A0A844AR97_RHIFR|nr:FkbM family methyltransferase [Sinorhizobium fredii]ASY72337.1 putative nucleotide-binding protein [Sinorhizobium fredii CCBAU 83666]KSV92332.1 DNA-binding protein [Sinorhizobium fredii USDA 205]MQX12856.1 FkbM family methyltransferase [Sinorhizobium fredii]GLS11087.1 nucleotide-binding protein [Sinorhizobium fredii]
MRAIRYFDKTVYFPDKPEKKRFFARLQSGQWEPDTFQNIARLVDAKTTFIDIGGWIGVTPYWAAQSADNVIVVEPDPVCFDILTQMKADNIGEVELVNAALSQDERLVLHSVGGGFGSSETSALIADDTGMAISAETVTIPKLQAMAKTERLCFKVDIEGYEYKALDQFRAIDRKRTAGVLLAVHPQILAASLSGPAVLRLIRTMAATARLIRSFRGFRLENRSAIWTAVRKSIARRELRGFDLLFLQRRASNRTR